MKQKTNKSVVHKTKLCDRLPEIWDNKNMLCVVHKTKPCDGFA